MTKSEAIKFYGGNVSELARALGIDQSTFYSWGDYPPGGRQLQLEALSKGELKAEPDCMKTKREHRAAAKTAQPEVVTPAYTGPDRRAKAA